MNLTVDIIRDALAKDAERTEAHYRELDKRLEAGLPSWDVFLTRGEWERTRDEGIKQGLIVKKSDHYVMTGFAGLSPPARILISGRVGEDAVNPIDDRDL